MSFKENDNKHIINIDNYEEYFLLYVDGELNEADRKQVDDFVIHHPELKSELDILLFTRLTPDDVTINKEELYSFSMDKIENEEVLLSFIDGEVYGDQKRKIEESINSGGAFKREYELLLKAKLDPTEIIAYPNKEELYKRTRRVIIFSSWLRAAAVFILIAAGFIIYKNRGENNITPSVAITSGSSGIQHPGNKVIPQQNTQETDSHEKAVTNNEHLAVQTEKPTPKKLNAVHSSLRNSTTENKNQVALVDDQLKDPRKPLYSPTEKIETSSTSLIAYVPATETINKSPVTSALSQRTINSPVTTGDPEIVNKIAAHSDYKGSLKSFLRKAARVIEKKTGIDPANDNEELLIGAVAVKIN